MLLNCLAPQVFRPIDFIILSFFEISKPYLTKNDSDTSNGEMNNWLCVILVHLYLLLTYSNEDQILIRLHHLMPQIVASYNESITSSTATLNQNFKSSSSKSSSSSSVYSKSPERGISSPASSARSSRNNSVSNKSSDNEEKSEARTREEPVESEKKVVDSESESNERDRSESVSTSYSNNTSTSNSSYNKHDANYSENKVAPGDGSGYYNDNTELDLNESALFLAKFLLKIVEKSFNYMEKLLKFNSTTYFSTNLSASAPTSLLRDFQTNSFRDLNYTQHLIANKLLFLMYIVNSTVYQKIANSISLLINDKAKTEQSKQS